MRLTDKQRKAANAFARELSLKVTWASDPDVSELASAMLKFLKALGILDDKPVKP